MGVWQKGIAGPPCLFQQRLCQTHAYEAERLIICGMSGPPGSETEMAWTDGQGIEEIVQGLRG